jgi:hypothetical protein
MHSGAKSTQSADALAISDGANQQVLMCESLLPVGRTLAKEFHVTILKSVDGGLPLDRSRADWDGGEARRRASRHPLLGQMPFLSARLQ